MPIDIKNFKIFKNLFFGIRNKRIHQGYGLLYNVKLDDKDKNDDENDDDISNYLRYEDEIPINVNCNFKDNTGKDRDYKKVSVYKKNQTN